VFPRFEQERLVKEKNDKNEFKKQADLKKLMEDMILTQEKSKDESFAQDNKEA